MNRVLRDSRKCILGLEGENLEEASLVLLVVVSGLDLVNCSSFPSARRDLE